MDSAVLHRVRRGTVSRAVAVVSLAAGLVVAGCSQVPTSGPVVSGNPVRAQEQPPYVAFGAAAPEPGADPAGIVDGFVDAMSAFHPGYDVAKQFLTPEAASTWEPSTHVLVHEGTRPSLEVVEDNRVEMTVTVSGTVLPDGSYITTEAGQTRQFQLELERVEGEWRISNPPEGTLISEDNFAREFEAHNLCFFDPGYRVFVPDPVYVPKSGQAATLLAQRLLDGPSDWLEPAVRTAFPESADLSVSSVPVESGTATVELSEEAQGTQPEQREQMVAQLACTLGGLTEVTAVAVNADGVSMLGQGVTAVQPSDYERYDPDRLTEGGALYAVRDTGVVVADQEDEFLPVTGPLGSLRGVDEVAVDPSRGRAATVVKERTELQLAEFTDGAVRRLLYEGEGLAAPAWDLLGLVWAVDRSGGQGRLVALDPERGEINVQGTELEELDVSRFSIAPDGTRLVLVADGQAYVGLIVRDGEGPEFISIDRLRPIGPEQTTVDLGWAGAERIAVLAHADDGPPELTVLDVFGSVQASRGPVPGAVSLATGPDEKHVVATEDEVLLEHEARARWTNVGEGRAPAYP